MPEVNPPEFVVMQIPSDVVRAELGTEEDRFIVAETAALPMPRLFVPRSQEPIELLEKALRRLPPLTEAQVRGELTEKGWTSDAIDASLARARRFGSMERSAFGIGAADKSAPFGIDHITRIGYRNSDGQEVIRKTERSGPGSQRVFVMRCTVCGHEYGSYGCDADIRRCPECQEGAPGIALVPP